MRLRLLRSNSSFETGTWLWFMRSCILFYLNMIFKDIKRKNTDQFSLKIYWSILSVGM